MAKQVNVSCKHNFDDEEIFAWISETSEDSYSGRLTDCVYADNTPSDWTDWRVFVGTEGQCLIFRGLYNTYGEKCALDWAERLSNESYQRFLNQFKTV